MNTELLLDGLTLSALGLGITFTALGLLIGLIYLLQALFSPKPKPAPVVAATPVQSGESQTEIEKLAVAMAIATCLLEDDLAEAANQSLGQSLERGHGRWWRRSTKEGKN